MLLCAKSIRDLSVGELFSVYSQSLRQNGKKTYSWAESGYQIICAEQDMYDYLKNVFFKTPGAEYFIWEENGLYLSAVRIEPYSDGYLLEALETREGHRREGNAGKLLEAVITCLQERGKTALYSHVSRRNTASLNLHRKYGFDLLYDYARFIDGAVERSSVTLKLIL